MKKRNKFHNFIIISIFYLMILLIIRITYSFFNVDFSPKIKTGNSKKSSSYKTSYILQQKKKEENSYLYHFIPTLTYLGTSITDGWKLYVKVPFDTEIIGCYHASTCIVEGETLTITNLANNKKLTQKNNSITMGFKMKTNQANYKFEVIGASFSSELSDSNRQDNSPTKNIEKTTLITPKLSITGGWDKLTTYKFEVENHSNNITLISWNAKFIFPENTTINSIWGGSYQYDTSSRTLTIQNPDWDDTLSPTKTTEVNMHITTNTYPYTPKIGEFIGITETGDTIKADIQIGGDSS